MAEFAEHDLTKKMAMYLDRHLIFPLLDFLNAKDIWPQAQLTDAKLSLLSKTNMIDYYAEIYKSAKDQEIPQVLGLGGWGVCGACPTLGHGFLLVDPNARTWQAGRVETHRPSARRSP